MLPSFIRPMLAASAEPFNSDEHIFEPKWDGIRCLAFVENGQLRLQSRQLQDITAQFPEVEDLRSLISGTILDGELVVMKNGMPSLSAIQERVHLQMVTRLHRLSRHLSAVYIPFDLLYLESLSLVDQPFIERRASLERLLLDSALSNVVLVKGISSDGTRLFSEVSSLGLEGLVAKSLYAPYLPGRRSRNWLKIKTSADSL